MLTHPARFSFLAFLLLMATSLAAPPAQLLADDNPPQDSRLAKIRTLNDKDFDMKVPATKEEWEKRRKELREQVQVAVGLWPMPEKTPLNAVVHGKIERDDYTIEKVFFASYPGHYVSGSLYVPKGKTGKLPVVLCPHGHWNNGRFYDAGEKAGQDQIDQGAEKTMEGARYPLQARCANLARMGCIVFHYDMVGIADSRAINHREGFKDAEADLRLQNFMGLQTWNSIRALDFVLALPNADSERVGVTGASGGGTQTFILCAIDDRPTAAFPAVMVCTEMQGGCICENAPYLRQFGGNIDIAAIFAPKPLGMSGADDWTINIEKKGLPELKKVYKLYGAEDMVMAKCFPQFKHNYNQVSREVMYNWFNKHLKLGQKEPVVEQAFKPVVPPKDLSVYDDDHPRPKDELPAERLRQYLTEASDKQMTALMPKDSKSLEEYRRVLSTALGVMVHDRFPAEGAIVPRSNGTTQKEGGVAWTARSFGRKDQGDVVPLLIVEPDSSNGTVVVWVHPDGKDSVKAGDKLASVAQKIIDAKATILAPDVFLTGSTASAKPMPVDGTFSGFTFGYNCPLLANRVQDIITAVAYAKHTMKAKKIYLAGFDSAGPWTVMASALCGNNVSRTAVDFDQFRFENVSAGKDAMMLPGALKYGGLPAFAALCAPGDLLIHGTKDRSALEVLIASYKAAGVEKALERHEEKLETGEVIKWLLK